MTVTRTSNGQWSDDDSRSSTSFDSSTSSNGNRRKHNPYAVVSAPYTPSHDGVTYGVSHQPLLGKCFFLPIPKIVPVPRVEVQLPQGAIHVQIRQVRFEIETGQVRWLVRALTGVHVLHAEKVVPGVINVWVANVVKAERIRSLLHQNMLFDFQGVFAPLTEAQHEIVRNYTQTRQFHTRSQRLPRETVSVSIMPTFPPARLQ